MPRTDDPGVDLSHQVARQESRKIEGRRALQRLVGSYALGAVAALKLLTYEAAGGGGFEWMFAIWVGVALLAFGLASFDQIAKTFKR